MKLFKTIVRAYPLTLFGTLTLSGALLLWAFSSLTENKTGLFLSVIGFVLLAFSILLTHLRFGFSDGDSVSFSLSANLHAGENSSAVRINCTSWGLPFFLRAHLRISGTLSSGGIRLFYIAREYRISGVGEYRAPLSLPAGGELGIRGIFTLRDVLGLARKVVGPGSFFPQTVSSSSVADLEIDMVHDSVSQDPNSLSHQAEQERVFVREYVSGDLARDINWKALARIGLLLTRVPPEAPRESKLVRLVVFMPPVGVSARERGRALVQLEHIRVLVSSFLESIRRAMPDYGFSICIGAAEYTIEPSERFDAFFIVLACAGFGAGSPGKNMLDKAIPENSWIIGSVSDSRLAKNAPEFRATKNNLILSRMRGAYENNRIGDVYRVSLLASFPGAVPALPLIAVFLPKKRRVEVFARNARANDGFPAGDDVLVFDCGVRL